MISTRAIIGSVIAPLGRRSPFLPALNETTITGRLLAPLGAVKLGKLKNPARLLQVDERLAHE
jgi:hypothetical protein